MKRTQCKRQKSGSIVLACLTTAILAACGGGDDAPPTENTMNTPPTQPVDKPASVVRPACKDCSAVDSNTYAGSGVGVWQSINTTGAAIDMPIHISGLDGQDVTLVFTNETDTARAMPMLPLTTSYSPSVVASELRWNDGSEALKRRIQEFNHTGWAALAGKKGSAPDASTQSAPHRAAVNDVRIWYHADDTARKATLRAQHTTTDGTTVNFWVENGEYVSSRITSAILDVLGDGFVAPGKIYDMLKSVGGPLWGGHNNYSDLIAGDGQPIDIVILNFDGNGSGIGMTGYFSARNAFKREPKFNPYSNESVSLYLDAEWLYGASATRLRPMLSTMAREAMHMQNFYRRGVKHGLQKMFDPWLEEATAMMMEDFASESMGPSSAYNAIRDRRFPDYIGYKAGSYSCSLVEWTPLAASCDSFSVSGSFGGFLNRQLGADFYKNLLNTMLDGVDGTDSVKALDQAIRSVAPASGMGEQLRRFSATAGSLMKAPSPAGYGFPSRTVEQFVLPSIDPQVQLPYRTLTQSVPAMLQSYASLPVVRQAIKGTHSETVKVPAGTSLSVVIQ